MFYLNFGGLLGGVWRDCGVWVVLVGILLGSVWGILIV